MAHEPGNLSHEVYAAADEARTAYLRDVDANDQISALSVAVDAAFAAHPALKEARDAVDFFDRVKASSEAEKIAVGTDHWNRLEAAVRAVAALAPAKSNGQRVIDGLKEALDVATGETQPARVHVRRVKPDPNAIPEGVYYFAEMNNFYDQKTRQGKGNAFFKKWHKRRDEFPTEAAEI